MERGLSHSAIMGVATMEISLSGSQDLNRLPPTPGGDPSAPCVIDLRRVRFLDPFAMVNLACIVTRLRSEGTPVHVIAPDEPQVAMYLSRMDLATVMQGCGATIDRPLPPHNRRDHEGYLLELQPFNDTQGAEQVASLIVARLEGQVSAQLLYPLHDNVGELGNNVDEHSESPVGGFMAAQTYNRGRDDEYMVVAMGDAGIGIPAHLGRRHSFEHDAEAIERALVRYVTGTDRAGRGVGLADFVEFVGYHGRAVVVSGCGRAIVHSQVHVHGMPSQIRGTLVGARLRCR